MNCILIKWRMLLATLAIGLGLLAGTLPAGTTGFEDLVLGSKSYRNGYDRWVLDNSQTEGVFVSGQATFNNHFHYDSDYDFYYWDGWAYSNRTDTGTSGQDGQYTAVPGSGAGGSSNYGVGFWGWYGPAPSVTFAGPKEIESARFTNVAYAYWAILQGDPFGRPFGHTWNGTIGDWEDTQEEDWFKLTITGKLDGTPTGSVPFLLADYTAADNADDYVVDTWEEVDLTTLGTVDELVFSLSSSDNDPLWGMNTPAYFAMDNLIATPEPSTLALLACGLLGLLWWRRRLFRFRR